MLCFTRGKGGAMRRINPMPLIFLCLAITGWYCSGMSGVFVINETITRFIRDGVLVLALLVPITAGMGINFAISIGAISAQIGILAVIILQIPGMPGLLLGSLMALIIAILLGYLLGRILNRVKGKEMITTIIIGFLANGLYQLIFLLGYGTLIKPINQEILLSRGIGIRNMVDLIAFRNLMEQIWLCSIGSIKLPWFMICLVLFLCLTVACFMNTRTGQKFRLVGEDMAKAAALGIDADAVRIQAMMVSTVLACLGQILFLQNMGMLNVYTAHRQSDIFAAAALLAGGASIKQARVRHVILGIFLFHSLFIVSPQAGQNLFGNAALGEYFRSFIAYGTIALALVLNQNRAGSTVRPPFPVDR